MGDQDFEQEIRDNSVWDPANLLFISRGTTGVGNGGTISHDVGQAPDEIYLQATAGARYRTNFWSSGATTFTVGLVRDNWGTEAAAGGTGSITHGLSFTPQAVFFQEQQIDCRIYVSSVTATVINYVIYVCSTGAAYLGPFPCNFYWYATGVRTAAKNIHWQGVRYT